MSRKLSLIVLCGGLLLALAGMAQAEAGTPQFARIDTALDAGVIDAEQALLYKFFYVFDPEKLPAEYRARDGRTGQVRHAADHRVRRSCAIGMSGATVTAIDAMLEPAGRRQGQPTSAPRDFFRLTYLTTGLNAVPTADTNPANGIPDYVERCATYMDTSWATEITNLGLHRTAAGALLRGQFREHGRPTATRPSSRVRRTRIVLENDFVGFPANDDPDGDALGAAKVTCAHEFKHASQTRHLALDRGRLGRAGRHLGRGRRVRRHERFLQLPGRRQRHHRPDQLAGHRRHRFLRGLHLADLDERDLGQPDHRRLLDLARHAHRPSR